VLRKTLTHRICPPKSAARETAKRRTSAGFGRSRLDISSYRPGRPRDIELTVNGRAAAVFRAADD